MVNLSNNLKNQMMLSSFTSSRQLLFFLFLAIVVLLHLGLLLPGWYGMIKRVEQLSNVSSRSFQSQLQSEIDKTTKLLNLICSTYTTNLATVLDSSLNGSKLSFPEIQNIVAPILFHALSTNPHLTQISYMDREGAVFSYDKDQNKTFASYSNSSFPNTYRHTQLIDKDTGKLYGNVVRFSPSIPFNNTSLFREALNSGNGSYSFLGTRWNNTQDLMFINTAIVNGNKGLVALGFLAKEVTEFYTDMDLNGGRSYLATKDGKILAGDSLLSFELMEEHNDQIVSCYSKGKPTSRASNLSFQGKNFMLYCSQFEMLGVQSVYVLATPRSTQLINFVHRYSRTTLVLLISIIAFMVVSIFSLLFMIYRATIREMQLRAALIKQMEATEQAERKSMNKSLAFASASHDIRASLAGMTGLIEICYDDVSKSPDLGEKLRQMDRCTKDLLGLLNSILDTSKIEAGKMQLEEEEFDVAQLLEDVVDLYHPMGAKKGTDLILDPCDGSVYKFSHVKGDRGKLRQILCNLLSNAVKFTSDGHVSVRAWARKPSLKSSITVSNQSGRLMQHLSCLFYKKNRGHNEDLENMNVAKNDPNSIELVFEVDDTGKGIPKEKQKEIFENYVQVKEISVGQGGTGLGLGIVQSLVRLMHGEIAVMDKDVCEKGTCFRFNVFLTICENAYESGTRENETELCSGDLISTPQLRVLTPSPKVEGSYVVLLIRNNERRRISEKFMESLGIKVFVVERWEQLSRSLKKIKRKWNNSCSKSLDWSIHSKCLTNSSSSHGGWNIEAKDNVPFSSTGMDGTDYILSLFRKTNYLRGTSLGFVLMVLDTSARPFSELCDVVKEFRNDLQNASCRVVWLANPISHSINFNSSLEEQMIDSDDIIKYKPFHGSRLYEVVRLLPEFGGSSPKREGGTSSQVGKIPKGSQPSSSSIYDQKEYKNCQNQELGSSSSEDPLRGKKILVADDSALLQKLASYNISKLGAAVDTCANGKEALELVSNGLAIQRKHGDPISLPYDYILMDCEMPIMSGYEATREIRKLEELYGVHIPIIALTAHTPGTEEANKTIEAGMDVYLSKPLKSEHLLEAIRSIHSKEK